MPAEEKGRDMVILNEMTCGLERFCDPGWSLTEMLAGEGLESDIQRAARLHPALTLYWYEEGTTRAAGRRPLPSFIESRSCRSAMAASSKIDFQLSTYFGHPNQLGRVFGARP